MIMERLNDIIAVTVVMTIITKIFFVADHDVLIFDVFKPLIEFFPQGWNVHIHWMSIHFALNAIVEHRIMAKRDVNVLDIGKNIRLQERAAATMRPDINKIILICHDCSHVNPDVALSLIFRIVIIEQPAIFFDLVPHDVLNNVMHKPFWNGFIVLQAMAYFGAADGCVVCF